MLVQLVRIVKQVRESRGRNDKETLLPIGISLNPVDIVVSHSGQIVDD